MNTIALKVADTMKFYPSLFLAAALSLAPFGQVEASVVGKAAAKAAARQALGPLHTFKKETVLKRAQPTDPPRRKQGV